MPSVSKFAQKALEKTKSALQRAKRHVKRLKKDKDDGDDSSFGCKGDTDDDFHRFLLKEKRKSW